MNVPVGVPRTVVRRLRALSGEDGVGLVELLVALSLLALVMAGTLSGLVGSMQVTGTNRHRVVAANLASGEMELIRATPFADLEVGLSAPTTTVVNGVTYSVQRQAEWIAQDAAEGGCDSPAEDQDLAFLRMTVLVRWPTMGDHPPINTESVLTPPVAAYDPFRGHLAVQVRDRDGVGAPGHRVTVTGPLPGVTQRSLVTTTTGCAFFAFLDPGGYDVEVDTPGHVDAATRTAVPLLSRTIAASRTATAEFDYDRAASLTVGVAGRGGGLVPGPLDTWIGNTNLNTLGEQAFPGETSLAPLFPFRSGYEVWVTGTDCDAHDPAPLRGDRVATPPGDDVAHTVLIGTVEIVVLPAEPDEAPPLLPVSARSIDADCGAAYGFGNTQPDGELVIALPWGRWEITVGVTTVAVHLDPANAGILAIEVSP